MSHYTITLGFEADNEAEAMEIVQAIAKEAGKVIRSFDRYVEIDDQDTKAVKDYSPEEKIDRIERLMENYQCPLCGGKETGDGFCEACD